MYMIRRECHFSRKAFISDYLEIRKNRLDYLVTAQKGAQYGAPGKGINGFGSSHGIPLLPYKLYQPKKSVRKHRLKLTY